MRRTDSDGLNDTDRDELASVEESGIGEEISDEDDGMDTVDEGTAT